MNVLAYEIPLPKEELTIEYIIQMRDSIGKTNIPGEIEGSYMRTEKAYTPFYNTTRLADKEAFETRATWDVKGDFMAGPFVNYAIKDKEKNRLLVLEGFMYEPNAFKRNNMFELEAIIRSVTFE